LAGSESKLFRSLYRTYRTVFPTVVVHPVRDPGDVQDDTIRNLILVATDGAAPPRSYLAARWRARRERNPRLPDLDRPIRTRFVGEIPVDDVPVLTDDYAPTDALLVD
jgi:hypothetical protein